MVGLLEVKVGALDKLRKLEEQLDEARKGVHEEFRTRRAELLKRHKTELRELEAEYGAKGNGRSASSSSSSSRVLRCSICVGKGDSGEGHNKRTHATWVKEQKSA
jgi:hypothetical protein